jgi:hypothetical protein
VEQKQIRFSEYLTEGEILSPEDRLHEEIEAARAESEQRARIMQRFDGYGALGAALV